MCGAFQLKGQNTFDHPRSEPFVCRRRDPGAVFLLPVCTENLIRVDAVMESPKLAE
jgi:hypothetical protein